MNNLPNLTSVRVWDLPTRLFHWFLVVCVLGLAITGVIGGDAMALHFRFGYAIFSLLLFRLGWGFIGGHWSRFATFIPAALGLFQRRTAPLENKIQEVKLGHSPLGGLSVLAMLALLSIQVATGLISNDEIAFAGPLSHWVPNEWVSQATSYHSQWGKWILLALVLIHLLAIIVYTWRRQRLVSAMVNGNKTVSVPALATRDDAMTRIKALALLALCSAAVYTLVTWSPPTY